MQGVTLGPPAYLTYSLGAKISNSHGLSWGQFLILRSLRQAKAAAPTPGELGAMIQASSSGVATMLRGLIDQHLVTRMPNPQDGRGALIRLTHEGDVRFEKIAAALLAANTKLFHGIMPSQDLKNLVALLTQLRQGLEDRAGALDDQANAN